jgi:hypothetical protein
MKFAERLKFTATGASAATITLSAAVAGFRTLAQAIADGTNDPSAIKVGDSGVPFTIEDGAGNKETSLFTVTSATVLTRTSVLSSSAGGTTAATFSGATLTVFSSMPASFASKLPTAEADAPGAPNFVFATSAPINTDGRPNFTVHFQTTPVDGSIRMSVKVGGVYVPVGAATPATGSGDGAAAPAPGKSSIMITPAQMTTVFGSTTMGTDFDGAPVMRLPDASSEIAFIADNAEVGQKYDVYMLWSLPSAPASLAPTTVTFAGEYTPGTGTTVPPNGTTKWMGIVPPQAAGIIERSQLPWSFTRADATRMARIRLGRRDDATNVNIQIRGFELVPSPPLAEANITAAGSLSPTVFNTPFAGTKVTSLLSLYTPIWSTANAVYVVAPVTIGGVAQSRVAKLNKSTYAMLQDIQIGTGEHDTTIGHRDGSVCVTDDGKVIAYGEHHHTPWKGMVAPTEDISALVATAAPEGLDEHCSYRRFFRNQFDGSMWMGVRGRGYHAGIYKWNGTTFERKGGNWLAGDGSAFLGSYGMEIAFTSATTLYVTTEYRQGNSAVTLSGYPRQNINVIKSVDGGATFTSMRGKALNLPTVPGSDDSEMAFPNNNLDHNSAVGRIAIGADGQPMLIASWQHPEETRRSLWVAKYNVSTNKWIRTRLLAYVGTIDAGTPHVAFHNGKVIVTVASTDDNVSGVLGTVNQLYIFTTIDSGATWKKYLISHVAGAYSGAYIDPAALRLDNKLRLLPDNTAAGVSVIWEMPVPA